MTMASYVRPALLLVLMMLGCAYRPARFADRPAVTELADDDPIPVPGRRELDWNWYLSDVYLRRSVLDTLDPKRPNDAGDVNALDEVPRSSWFQPLGPDLAMQHPPIVEEGPPVPPLTLVPDVPRATDDGICVQDARGIRFELRRDGADRPEMKTSAAVVASRLIRAFGLLAPEVSIVYMGPSDFADFDPAAPPNSLPSALVRFLRSGPPSIDGRYRMSATRWPVGIDVGVSESFDTRGDDANDVIAHRDRRTLRSLKVLGAWLAISGISPRKTRDAYVGEPGQGHMRHYLVQLEDALGAGSVVGRGKKDGLRTDLGGGPSFNLMTFGLWPGSDSTPTQRQMLALGNMGESVNAGEFKASPPYAPIVHCQAADGYWAAKRIAAIRLKTIVESVYAARIMDSTARVRLVQLLVARRQAVVRYWYGQVTPAEVARVSGATVVFRDEALRCALDEVGDTRYRITVLDGDGRELTSTKVLELPAAEFAVEVPGELVGGARDRLILRLHAEVRGDLRPRAVYVHLRPGPFGVRVIGIRH